MSTAAESDDKATRFDVLVSVLVVVQDDAAILPSFLAELHAELQSQVPLLRSAAGRSQLARRHAGSHRRANAEASVPAVVAAVGAQPNRKSASRRHWNIASAITRC